jgi:Flp pilus assembly protein TadD
VEWIQARVEPEPGDVLRIRSWYGDATKARYYIRKKPGYRYVEALPDSADWDYEIVQTVAAKHAPGMLHVWPLPGTVHEVKAEHTPLCAVVANPRSRAADEVLGLMREWVVRQPTGASYHALGLTAQRYGRPEESIAALEKAVELAPHRAMSWNELGVAYGRLQRWEQQIEACREALAIDPRLQVARSNLVSALEQHNEAVRRQAGGNDGGSRNGRTFTEHLAAHLKLYREGRYEESAEAARLALRESPANAVGHHGLCAAYGGMGRWADAEDACATAVALQPDYEQARQGLERARAAAAARGAVSSPPSD